MTAVQSRDPLLPGETVSTDRDMDCNEVPSEAKDSSVDDEAAAEEVDEHNKVRRKPGWDKNYVLSTLRSGPNLMTTPRKQTMPQLNIDEELDNIDCSICKTAFKKVSSYLSHVIHCRLLAKM